MGLETVFVLGGAGITLGLLDSILRQMGKGEIGMILNVIATGAIGFYCITQIEKLFDALRVFL